MLRTATAGLGLVAALALSGCFAPAATPAATPAARIGAPDRGDSTPTETLEQGRAPALAEPAGLTLRSITVHPAGPAAPVNRAARREFSAGTERLSRDFRAVWVSAGTPGTAPGRDYHLTVTGDPSPELLARVARLPVEVEVLSGNLLTAREYAALASDVRRALADAGVGDGAVVSLAPLGDALAVHTSRPLSDLGPVSEALTRVAADLDAHAAAVRGRLAALRGAVPIRLYALSAEGEAVPAGGIPAGSLP